MYLNRNLLGLVILTATLFLLGSTGPATAGMGGPDDFGYVWIDSDEPGGPTYNWVDITGRGTRLYMDDDDNQPVPMPFSFHFYDNTFSGNLNLCSNGFASFTSTSTQVTNYGLPSTSAPENLLAAFWDDLDPSDGGEIWYYGNSDSLIISFVGVPHWDWGGGLGSFTLQLILTADDAIHYQYESVGNGYPTDEGTIGIQNDTKTIGLQVAYDEPYVHDQLAIDILLPPVMVFCDNLAPQFCQGKKFYFMLTVNNRTGSSISGRLTFSGYADYGCDPANVLVTMGRDKTYPAGTTEEYYKLKVPNAASPGRYSASIGGTLGGEEVFCCMNTEIIECVPWRMGGNTEWELVQMDRPEVLPSVTELHQNYPNPFNATTNITFDLAEAGNVSLNVYDLSGRLVTSLVDGQMEAGEHVVSWDASSVSSGVYFLRLATADFSATKTMNLLK